MRITVADGLMVTYSRVVIRTGILVETLLWVFILFFRGYKGIFMNFEIRWLSVAFRGRGTGGQWGHVPPPHFFWKWKKCPFFWAKVSRLKNEKSISWMNALFCRETKSPFRSSKASVNAISDVIETPYLQKFSFCSWTRLLTRREKHKAILMFKTINDLTPFYLHELFESRMQHRIY
jgi:hypothetical protein